MKPRKTTRALTKIPTICLLFLVNNACSLSSLMCTIDSPSIKIVSRWLLHTHVSGKRQHLTRWREFVMSPMGISPRCRLGLRELVFELLLVLMFRSGTSNRSSSSSSSGTHGPARCLYFETETGRDGCGVSIGVGGVDRSAWR